MRAHRAWVVGNVGFLECPKRLDDERLVAVVVDGGAVVVEHRQEPVECAHNNWRERGRYWCLGGRCPDNLWLSCVAPVLGFLLVEGDHDERANVGMAIEGGQDLSRREYGQNRHALASAGKLALVRKAKLSALEFLDACAAALIEEIAHLSESLADWSFEILFRRTHHQRRRRVEGLPVLQQYRHAGVYGVFLARE